MIRICATCGRKLGTKAPFKDKRISHSICQKCDDEQMEKFLKKRTK